MATKQKPKICKNCWYAKLLFNLYHCEVDLKAKHAQDTCKEWREAYDPATTCHPCRHCGQYACECYT